MITKIQAAERQLDTAIRLFFENIDHLSSYTLAAASREITDDLCEKQKHELFREELARVGDAMEVRLSFREEMKIIIKDAHFKDAMRLFRKRQNFLKHADTDPDNEMHDVSIKELSLAILFAVKNFSLLEKRLTLAMSLFIKWLAGADPRILKRPKPKTLNDAFYRQIADLRQILHDPYSKDAFFVMHGLLKEHYQPE